jgi:hypothetical protein
VVGIAYREDGSDERHRIRRDHLEALADTPDLPFHLVVSPSRGRFHPAITAGPVHAGDVLGHVQREHGTRDAILARVTGFVLGARCLPTQPVCRGAVLFWIAR